MKRVSIFIGIIFAFLLSQTAGGYMAIPPLDTQKSFEGQIKNADLIVRLVFKSEGKGKIREASTDRLIPVLEQTFQVMEAIKGDVGSTFVLVQLAPLTPAQAQGLGIFVRAGHQKFQKDHEYLLFLGAPSTEGFRSVLARYAVQKEGSQTVVVDPEGIPGFPVKITSEALKKGGALSSKKFPTAVSYDAFTTKVRTLIP